jgi:hypothetical protein
MNITRVALPLPLPASVGLGMLLGTPRLARAFGPAQKRTASELPTRGSTLRFGSLTSRFFMSPWSRRAETDAPRLVIKALGGAAGSASFAAAVF